MSNCYLKWARWSKPCILIGYPSRRDEPILPTLDFPRWSRKYKKFSSWPCNNIIHYFIEQACSVKMAEYWPHWFLHFYWPRPGCALWPVAPTSVTFVLGRPENLCFFTEIICWAHWISQVQSAGLPSIFLRAQPCKRKAGWIKTQIFSHLNLTPGQ